MRVAHGDSRAGLEDLAHGEHLVAPELLRLEERAVGTVSSESAEPALTP